MENLPLFKNTLKLLVLTKNCTEEERNELLTYISQLENLLVDTQFLLNSSIDFKNRLDKLIQKNGK